MALAYHSTKDLCERYRCSSRTLFRRMKRAENPFPPPCIKHTGSCNLWDAEDVARWEALERARARGDASNDPAGRLAAAWATR